MCASSNNIETIRTIGASPVSSSDVGASASSTSLIVGLADLPEQIFRRLIRGPVIFDERFANFFRARADQFDLAFQEKGEAVDAVEIERISGRDDETVLVPRDRDHLKAARVGGLNLGDHLLRDNEIGKIDPLHVRLGGEAARDIVGGNDAVAHEHVDQTGRSVGAGTCVVDLVAGHEADVLEEVEEVLFVGLGHRGGAGAGAKREYPVARESVNVPPPFSCS